MQEPAITKILEQSSAIVRLITPISTNFDQIRLNSTKKISPIIRVDYGHSSVLCYLCFLLFPIF